VSTTCHLQRDVEVLGLRLRYVDVGPTDADAPGDPLLLVHGLSSRIEEYEALIAPLARRHRVLVVDLPGSGYSDKPDRPYTLSLYEDVLLAFLDAVGAREAHVGGGSLGGNLALRLAHRAPDRFRRIAAWAPAGAWEPSRWIGKIGRLLGGRLTFWPVVFCQSRYWYAPSWPGREAALRDVFAHYREVMSAGFVRMYWEIAAGQMEESLFPFAPQIRQPTLLAWGDKDLALGMGAGVARLRKLLPRAELRVFPGARHSLASEIPELLASTVDDFLKKPQGHDSVK